MKKRIVIILSIIVTLETLIIIVFFVEIISHKGDFSFKNNINTPFPHSFNFVFNKSNDTYGFIALGNEGDFSSILLSDKSGRLITVGFDDGHIVSYVIIDNKYNYEMQTFFVKSSLYDENNVILSRQERFNSTKNYYFIDYNSRPFLFNSEIPIEFEEFRIDAVTEE